MWTLLTAMPQSIRALAFAACLASLLAGLGTALAATWQEQRDAGFDAFANADYAAAAAELERAAANAEASQADARERSLLYERLTTSYLATRWFGRARDTISRWDRVLADAGDAAWVHEHRSRRDSLATLVAEVIGEPEPEVAADAPPPPSSEASQPAAAMVPTGSGSDSDDEAEVDVPFEPDTAPPVAAPLESHSAAALDLAPAAAPLASGYGLHLVSLTDKAAVAGSWAILQEAYPEILAGKDLAVRKVDLGDQGVYYRLHAATFGAAETAQATCEKLRALDQYCVVVDLE